MCVLFHDCTKQHGVGREFNVDYSFNTLGKVCMRVNLVFVSNQLASRIILAIFDF